MNIPTVTPMTFPVAVLALVACLNSTDREWLLSLDNETCEAHHGVGTLLRNKWDLWNEKNPLVKDFRKRFDLFGHADDISGLLLHCVQQEVRGKSWHAEDKAEEYRAHWITYGVNPKTGAPIPPKQEVILT